MIWTNPQEHTQEQLKRGSVRQRLTPCRVGFSPPYMEVEGRGQSTFSEERLRRNLARENDEMGLATTDVREAISSGESTEEVPCRVPNSGLTIAANPATGNPAAISRGFGALNSRQSAVLEQLPDFGSSTIAHKSFGQRDLSALTAATGDEFAMFSVGGRRLLFRGDAGSVPINPDMASQLAGQGWRWSSHTHPGGAGVLRSSIGDRAVLDAMGAQRSSIFNSLGQRSMFTPRGDSLEGWRP